MRNKTNKNILNIVLVCLAFFVSADMLSANNPVRIDTVRTQLVIPRPALESVPTPLVKSPTDPIASARVTVFSTASSPEKKR